VRPAIDIHYLNRPDVEALALTDAEILAAVERGLAMQGRGATVIEPRVHLEPGVAEGHFNVLRGAIGGEIDAAGVKVVGDFVANHEQGLPSELGLLSLFDPRTGAPRAVIDASLLTDMRTGAVTAIGARHLARPSSRVLGHVGARGTAYWNVRLLDGIFGFDEIRVHSRRRESREAFAQRLSRDLGKPVRATEDWRDCVEGADIVVEASRLSAPEPLLRTEWIAPGALVVPYGTMSAVELSLTEIASKVVVDDWGQCASGRFGALRAHVDSGRLTRETLHAELGQIVAGLAPGREHDDETIVLWHRGLSLSDIALGHAMLEKARATGVGTMLRYA
jgi:ornithine cyclodeaminase